MATRLTGSREPDLTYLLYAGAALSWVEVDRELPFEGTQVLQPGQLVVLKDDLPHTTRERLASILEESGLSAGTPLPPGLSAMPAPSARKALGDMDPGTGSTATTGVVVTQLSATTLLWLVFGTLWGTNS